LTVLLSRRSLGTRLSLLTLLAWLGALTTAGLIQLLELLADSFHSLAQFLGSGHLAGQLLRFVVARARRRTQPIGEAIERAGDFLLRACGALE
jgi:hypothetical protein